MTTPARRRPGGDAASARCFSPRRGAFLPPWCLVLRGSSLRGLCCLTLLLFGLAAAPRAETPVNEAAFAELLAPHAESAALLKRRTIRVQVRGCVAADFPAVCAIFERAGFLDRVQAAYRASLAENEKPAFTLTPVGDGRWIFENDEGQRAPVAEAVPATGNDGVLRVALYASGERSFGRFESLTLIEARADGDGRLEYAALVHAFPHGAIQRFFIRNLGLIERYFRRETQKLESFVERVARHLAPAESAGGGDGLPDRDAAVVGGKVAVDADLEAAADERGGE